MERIIQLLLITTLLTGCELLEIFGNNNPCENKLDQNYYGIDNVNKIILYNDDLVEIVNNCINLGNDSIYIMSATSEIEIGEQYSVSLFGQNFQLFRTEMPIIIISTNHNQILQDSKICGTMTLLENGKEPYNSYIGIELRGSTSISYPKKSYSIELWKNSQVINNRSLLGMRIDDDWILDGMWNEPLRIRDFTSHDLWLEIASKPNNEVDFKMGIKRKYCELFLNNKYLGLYYIGEKVDEKQLKLKEFDKQIEGELYKGYAWANGTVYSGLDDFDNNSPTWSGYEVKYPKNARQLDWTNLHEHVDFIVNSTQSQFNKEISSRINIENAIDYYIFLNLIYATDNRGKNIYTAKLDKESSYFFIPWDMDGSFGNNWNGERINITNRLLSNGLYEKLLEFPDFTNKTKEKWFDLRNDVLNIRYLEEKFKNNYEFLMRNGICIREEMVPNISQNYDTTEIDFIESWIERRIVFLDSYFNNF